MQAPLLLNNLIKRGADVACIELAWSLLQLGTRWTEFAYAKTPAPIEAVRKPLPDPDVSIEAVLQMFDMLDGANADHYDFAKEGLL